MLYEVSLLAARVGLRKRIKRQEEARKQEELEAEEAKAELKYAKTKFQEHLWGSEDEKANAARKR